MSAVDQAPRVDVVDLEEQIRAFYDRAEQSEARRAEHDNSIDWQMVVDTSNDAFLCVDASGMILQWSLRAEELFGWRHDEAVGMRLDETIFPNGDGQSAAGVQLLTLAGQEGKRLEVTARRRNGADVPVEISMSMMTRGGAVLFNAFIHDITARRQLQAQLAHGQKLESIGQLSAGIAHEINTPTQYVGDNTRFIRDALDDLFGAIDAYAKLADAVRGGGDTVAVLAEVEKAVEDADVEYLSTELRDAVDQSLSGVDRVASIVRAMKEFSHPGTAIKTPTDLNAAIAATVTVATNEWKYVATVETDFDESLPLVPVLPGDFNQVILNIVVNGAHAIRAANEQSGPSQKDHEEKGEITIRTRRVDDFAEVQIADNGTGIPEEIVNKIFDPFFTTKDVGVGTGQGLAISRSVVVDKHQGTLEVKTSVGQGSTFTLRIPLAANSTGGLV